MTLWHVTSREAVDSILRDGLRGGIRPRNRGVTLDAPHIYALTRQARALTDAVALGQIWPEVAHGERVDYAVIRIDRRGVIGPTLADDVAEETAQWHLVIRQEVIAPEYLSLRALRRARRPTLKETRKALIRAILEGHAGL